jgi:hypothetical protein
MMNQGLGRMGGMRIVEDATMVVPTGEEDWSRVRSPARARRRRAKHRQNIRPVYRPSDEILYLTAEGVMVMHPATADLLRKEIDKRLARENRIAMGLRGTVSP